MSRGASIIGFEALGRHGALGVVVDVSCEAADPPAVVVRGGVSDALLYYVPCSMILSVSSRRRTVVLDADLADFASSLRDDGTVVLRAAPP
jgi:hypothetical protein